MPSADDDIISSISYAIGQQRSQFAALAKTHNKDIAKEIISSAILNHLRMSGYDVVRVKPAAKAPNTHPPAKGN